MSGLHFRKLWCMGVCLLLFCCLCAASALPPRSDNRVADKVMSDEDHFNVDEGIPVHNPDFDHEAFLGKDDAKTYEHLTPEESKRRLGLLYDKIDKDRDGLVSQEELHDWIKYVQTRYITMDTDKQWAEQSVESGVLSWKNYLMKTYGLAEEPAEDSPHDYKDMMRRDARRWSRADVDGDKSLNKLEYMNFIHPEEVESMKDIVVDETLEDIDKDKDGFISLQEYIGDMWPNVDASDDPEPEWVMTEREQFSLHRDHNKDGHMDRDEVRDWILPSTYDHTEAEAKHLFHEADTDRDGHLSKEEVVEKYDLFVGSQATDFGDALRRHDEF